MIFRDESLMNCIRWRQYDSEHCHAKQSHLKKTAFLQYLYGTDIGGLQDIKCVVSVCVCVLSAGHGTLKGSSMRVAEEDREGG